LSTHVATVVTVQESASLSIRRRNEVLSTPTLLVPRMDLDTPVLDNHMHLDPDHGRGIDAVEDFAHLGGTHLLVVTNPPGIWASSPIRARTSARCSSGR